MERAAQGDLVTFAAAVALLGAAIRLAWGAVWGAAFFALAYGVGLQGWGATVAGVAYGLLVMVFMSLVTLPITASLFGGGAPIRDMPQMVGWGTFSLEHALFGLVIGVGVALAARTTVTAEEPARLEQRRAAA